MNGPELIFTASADSTLEQLLETIEPSKTFILCDSNTKKFCLPLIDLENIHVIEIEPGEVHKNIETSLSIIDSLTDLGANRRSLLINLGGGVVSDIGGFCASIFKRGIRFINVPTTLLAMTDAAIGGKTGIDHRDFKNHIGTFTHPEAIVISEEFLDTLPAEEIEAAWSEIIKTAVMLDSDLFNDITEGKKMEHIIRKTALCKKELTDSDFRETGDRQILNFGHTIGHAYESLCLSRKKPVLHGYAVAKGILAETGIALHMGMLSQAEADCIKDLILEKTGSITIDQKEFKALLPYLSADKKNTDALITFSLPEGIGHGRYGIKLDIEDLKNWKNQGYF